jgi:hypothetical protein
MGEDGSMGGPEHAHFMNLGKRLKLAFRDLWKEPANDVFDAGWVAFFVL